MNDLAQPRPGVDPHGDRDTASPDIQEIKTMHVVTAVRERSFANQAIIIGASFAIGMLPTLLDTVLEGETCHHQSDPR